MSPDQRVRGGAQAFACAGVGLQDVAIEADPQQADIERAKDQAMRVVTIGSRWDLEGGHGQGACRAG